MLDSGITVVIPTYNRSNLISLSLDSLLNQTLDGGLYEVIVVDDGSTDDTQKVVEEYSGRMNVKYFYQKDEGFRAAKARNIAISNARFSICVFFDSGMLAEEQLLKKHFDVHRKYQSLALIGLAFCFDGYETKCEKSVRSIIGSMPLSEAIYEIEKNSVYQDCRMDYLKKHRFSLSHTSIPWLLFWTCHTSVSTKSLIDIGGFDENFNCWGGEDVELAIRLHQNGVPFKVIESAKAIHYPHEKVLSERQRDSLKNCQYIHKKHNTPESYLLSLGFYTWSELIEKVNADSDCVSTA